MISEKLNDDMKAALKAGDKVKLSVIRMLRSELKNAAIAAGGELSEAQEEKVVASYAKKRKEAKEEYQKARREDLAEKEQVEYELTMSYLPAQLDEAAIAAIVRAKIEETGATGPADFGRVMKAVMDQVGSQSDGRTVSAIVKKTLAG